MLKNANSDHNIQNNKGYIPYVIHNRNNALLNKYNKYKVDKSYSPVGKQKYLLKNYEYQQVASRKLPVIHNNNNRKMNGVQHRLI